MCVYMCIHVHLYVCTFVYMYVCVYVCGYFGTVWLGLLIMGHSRKRQNTLLACPNVVFLIMDDMRTEEKWVPRKALALWDKSRNWNDSF